MVGVISRVQASITVKAVSGVLAWLTNQGLASPQRPPVVAVACVADGVYVSSVVVDAFVPNDYLTRSRWKAACGMASGLWLV